MDNIQKFEDFLDRLQGLLDNAKKQGHIIVRVEDLENAFPELKESEEEVVRKEIIAFLKENYETGRAEETRSLSGLERWIAWLEKQNHDGKKWIYEDAYLKEKEQLIQDGIDEVLENPQKYGLEKQGEQKPILIIPRFRVGDKIRFSKEEPLTITKIDERGYWSEELFICDFDEECCWDLISEQKPFDYENCNIQQKDFAPKSAMEE